jgi:outer membrane lipoprotein-sorting protein
MRITRQYGFGMLVLVAATAVLLSVPLACAQNPDQMMPDARAAKAKAVLQQAIDALGGAAYLNVHNSDCTGRYAQFQHSGEIGGYLEIREYREMPDKIRMEYDPKAIIVNIYAGDKGWTLDRSGVSDVPATDMADYQEQLKMQMGNILRNRLDDRSLFFRYGGSDVVDLKQADWSEIGDQGHTLRIAVGRSDHLPLRSVLQQRDPKTGENTERSTFYTSYHLIGGIQTPFRESRFLNGRQVYQVFWESCAYNVDLPANFFTRESLEQHFNQEHGKKKSKK